MRPASSPGFFARVRRRVPRGRRERVLFFLKWGAAVGCALAAVGLTTIALLFWIWGSDPALPSISKLDDYRPAQVSRVLAADGTVVGEIYRERRTLVPYERLPKHLVQAFVAAEDANFYKHEGISYTGMVRAFLKNVLAGRKKEGASTITQQVVKNLLLTRERAFKRKFQEIILARRLENALTKDEILTLYANEIYFGGQRYGVEEAARYYFGKRVEELDVGEAALIAGLPKGPEDYTPKKPENQGRAKERQSYVLRRMVATGVLDQATAQRYIDAPIKIVADPDPMIGAAPEWVDLARRELEAKVGKDDLDKAGAQIKTTLHLPTQKAARAALQSALRAYDGRQKYGQKVKHLSAKEIDAELKRLAKAGPPAPGVEGRAVVRAVFDADHEMVVDLGGKQASVLLGLPGDERYNPDGKKPSARFQPGDLVRVMKAKDRPPVADRRPQHAQERIELAPGPEGAVVVLDPRTRNVLAVVGGYSTAVGDFNRATMAKRQAGSTFKPFVYAAAIDSGEFTAASIVNDAPEVYDLWKPKNYGKGEFQGPLRLRVALARSINTIAIKTIYDITPARVAKLAHAMGIGSTLPEDLSLALGSGEVTPLELTNAFASFAASGRVAPVRSVVEVGGEAMPPVEAVEVLRPEVAYVVLDMMKSVITEGSGGAARGLKTDVAGKTGTSNESRDAWFVGVTPELAIGVWIGFDDFTRELGSDETGGKSAIPVFVDLVKQLSKRPSHFSRPPGVVEARIDKATGLLAPPGASDETAYTEVFVAGTAPVELAPAPGEVDGQTAVSGQYDDYDDSGAAPPEQPAPE